MSKITVVKVLPHDGVVSVEDLERWKNIFAEHKMTLEEALATGEIQAEVLPPCDECVTLVKIGGENYVPTPEDLETWKQVFEEAQGDPDFKIFTHPDVKIEVIQIGDVIRVE